MSKLPSKKRTDYIDNAKFFDEMKKYHAKCVDAKEKGLPTPKASDYIGNCLYLICTRLAYRPNFINYSYNDEMIDDAIENCVAALGNFDPEKTQNPFGYYTLIAWRAMVRRLHTEKKQAYIKYKVFENEYVHGGLTDHQDDGDHGAGSLGMDLLMKSDTRLDLVVDYENKLEETKKKLGNQKKTSYKKGVENLIQE